jgi:hypothetical protein
MSKIALSGNASGTGTFTFASPNSNTDRTLTLPDATGTILTTATAGVPVNGPAFSAYLGSNQTVTQSTWTKLQINTEEFDTNSCFDSTTNYRFTPTVAGYYQVNATLYIQSPGQTYNQAAIYKNGSVSKTGVSSSSSGLYFVNVSALIYLNGSTDYIELYAQTTGGSPTFGAGTSSCFQAAMVRSAT